MSSNFIIDRRISLISFSKSTPEMASIPCLAPKHFSRPKHHLTAAVSSPRKRLLTHRNSRSPSKRPIKFLEAPSQPLLSEECQSHQRTRSVLPPQRTPYKAFSTLKITPSQPSVSYLILYILYYTILYYTILYSTLLYSTLLYSTLLYYTILYSTLLYSTLLYYTILYYTILYYTILYYTILYYTIL